MVCGDADFGIRERNSPVREEGSRCIEGLWLVGCRLEDAFTTFGGIGAVDRLPGLWLAGRGARLESSAIPIQQNRPRLLAGCGRGLGLSGRELSIFGFS